jgi:ABC-type phosphate/phosphonate transport system substrate-binding protein
MGSLIRWTFPGLLVLLTFLPGGVANQGKPIQIGMVNTLLAEQPKSLIEIATDDFKTVLKKATGFDGEVVSRFGVFELAEKLDNKQVDFAVFHAHEFAWVRQKHPQLQPLVIAVDKQHTARAYLIVRKNSDAKTIADLRGKKLDMPVGTKEPCRMFLRKLCAAVEPKGPAALFGSIAKSETRNDALDQVARDKAQATIVDMHTLEFYKEVKGAVFEKNLRVLQESEEFPAAVIAYKPGALDAKTLEQFRDGLLKAHTIREGREMMKAWNVDALELPPKSYNQSLAEILKAYPAPESKR